MSMAAQQRDIKRSCVIAKTCKQCRVEKSPDHFAFGPHGYMPTCDECVSLNASKMTSKTCASCDKDLPISDFNIAKKSRDGYQRDCKECANKVGRKWYSKNTERAADNIERSFHKYYGSVKGHVTHMLNNATQRARKLGVKCTLTREWIRSKLENGYCEATGIKFKFLSQSGKGHVLNSFSPSMDRIERKGDYSPENVQIVVWIYNRAKGAFPEADLIEMCHAVVARQEKP